MFANSFNKYKCSPARPRQEERRNSAIRVSMRSGSPFKLRLLVCFTFFFLDAAARIAHTKKKKKSRNESNASHMFRSTRPLTAPSHERSMNHNPANPPLPPLARYCLSIISQLHPVKHTRVRPFFYFFFYLRVIFWCVGPRHSAEQPGAAGFFQRASMPDSERLPS